VVVHGDEVAAFLAPLPASRLPLSSRAHQALSSLGIRTIGQVAALPHASVLDRLGREGERAWLVARGGDDPRLTPRIPPDPMEESMDFPESVGALPALEASLRILIGRICERTMAHGCSVRALILRARLEDGGSWTRTVSLREATTDPRRIGIASLHHLAHVAAPVTRLAVEADAGGPAGAGQRCKLANQVAVAVGMVAWCEALAHARAGGLDPALVQEVIGGGAAGSWALTNLAPRSLAGDFAPGFLVRHLLTDIRLAREAAEAGGVELPGLVVAEQLYDLLATSGGSEAGTQALYALYVEADRESGTRPRETRP
jgi:hypothetical protein